MRIVLTAILIAALVGCDRPAPEIDDDDVASDTVAAAGAGADRRNAGMMRGQVVDANALEEGAAVGELRVANKNIQPAPASPLGVTGSLSFAGELELMGSYRAHFDYPEVREPCFWVDLQDWEKLPRVKGDERLKWFCFQNGEDALRELGALGTETRAVIIIDAYTINLQQSDVWDTARLVRVVRKDVRP